MKRLMASLAVCLSITLAVWAGTDFETLDRLVVKGNSIVMSLSGPVKYHAFKIANPPRLVV